MSEYLDSAEEKLREIYQNTPPEKREDTLVKFVKQKLYYSYKNGLRDGKKQAEQESQGEEQNEKVPF